MTTNKTETASKKDVQKLQRAIVDGLEDVKAMDIQVFNTEHLSPLFERVIVASGASNRQTKALASSVRDAVREAGFPKPRIEGEDNGEWIIVDCGPAVAHIMQPAIRQYYHLEEIWGDTPVRLKLGAAKPVKAAAPAPEKAVSGPARKPGRGAAGKTATADAAAGRKAAGSSKKPVARKAPERPLAPPAPVLPSATRPARKVAAKATPAPSASAKSVPPRTTAARSTPAKKAAAVPSKVPMQKLVVPAPGPKAPAKKATAKTAPAKKVVAKKAAVRKPAAR